MRRAVVKSTRRLSAKSNSVESIKDHQKGKSCCLGGIYFPNRYVIGSLVGICFVFMCLTRQADKDGEGIYAIMGGTGMQGGSAIDYLLRVGVKPSRIKTLTRDQTSKVARELSEKGIEVIEGKNEAKSWGELLDGAECVFAITFTDFEDSGGELRRGRELFDLIVESDSIKRVVFSGGERTEVPSLNAKADIEDYARDILAGSNVQCTFLHTSFFLENMLEKGRHKRYQKVDGAGNLYELSLPLPFDRKIAMISARDIGFIAGHILQGKPFDKTTSLAIVGDLVSPEIFLEVVKEFIPTYAFVYRQADIETLSKALGHAQATLVIEMYNNFFRQNSNETLTQNNMKVTRDVYANTMSLKTWVAKYARQILEED